MNLVMALLISLTLVLGVTAEGGSSLFLGGFGPLSTLVGLNTTSRNSERGSRMKHRGPPSTVQLNDLRPAILDDLMAVILNDLRPAILNDLRPSDLLTFVADQEPDGDAKLC